MDGTKSSPPEIRAEVEVNILFDALRRGDYAAAAKAQERLHELGWYITRERPRSKKRNQKPLYARQEAAGREGGRGA